MNDIQHMLCDTIDRYYFTAGAPPKRMRGSRRLGDLLMRELDWMPMIYDPVYAAKQMLNPDEFQFRGVTVKCDLNTDTPTVLAVLDR